MSLLEIVETNPRAEEIIRQYDGEAGCCLLCNNLFDSLEDVARTYSLELMQIIAKLKKLDLTTEG
jgi:predicted DNA-binding ribbon-helix-helix protein